jgi:hypothetical protein
MKKIILSATLLSLLFLASCGKSACDCMKEGVSLMEKSAKADPADAENLAKEAADLQEKCKDFKPEDFKDCK